MTLEEILQKYVVQASSLKSLDSSDSGKEFVSHLTKIRDAAILDVKSNFDSGQISSKIGIDVINFLVDVSLVIGVGSSLQKILTDRLKTSANGKVSQIASHRVVDLWGKLEASRALCKTLTRKFELYSLSNDYTAKSITSECAVLLDSLRTSIVEVGGMLGTMCSFQVVSEIMDYALGLTRSQGYSSLDRAVVSEIEATSV